MSEEPKTENQVTVIPGADGFDDIDAGDRLIQGTIIKCVDGHWAAKDGTAISPETKLIALATATALQHWSDQRPVETIVKRPGQPLPDVDELNVRIPKKEWEKGLDGNPRPPWVKQYIAYLLDPKDASVYTFINSTTGAEIAVNKLKDRVRWMRALRGEKVVPVVKLASAPMKTGYGQKMRPEFTVDEWRELGGLPAAPAVPALEHVGKPVEEPTLAEELNDAIPTFDKDEGKTGQKAAPPPTAQRDLKKLLAKGSARTASKRRLSNFDAG